MAEPQDEKKPLNFHQMELDDRILKVRKFHCAFYSVT